MFGRLFRYNKKSKTEPKLFAAGRYSDNNKSIKQAAHWTDAENLFKEKKYYECIDAFFRYLKDEQVDNVVYQKTDSGFTFLIYQGSKIIRGTGNPDHLHAKTTLAKMPQPSVPVMRRLLENNYLLFYSRFSLDDEKLVMQFDSEIATANPNKLYYALKELCTTADKQDDLLIQDFALLETFENDHVIPISENEKQLKYDQIHKWINEALDAIKDLETEKHSGAITFLILALVYRIDYLATPEGGLMLELEKIQGIFFRKDNLSAMEKNRLMLAGIEKFRQHTKEEFFNSFFKSVSTFSIRAPKSHQAIRESITAANKNVPWNRDNNYPEIGRQVSEYGIAFCQYSYSLPKPVSELFQLFMQVNYPDYFTALGLETEYYNIPDNRFKTVEIESCIESIIQRWKNKYTKLSFPSNKLKYDNLMEFNFSYTNILADLDLDT